LSMTLDEYNRRRAPSDTTPLYSLGTIAFGLLAFVAHSTVVAVGTAAVSVLILFVLGVRTVKRLEKVDEFRCPSCGGTPHRWVAPGPDDDRAATIYEVDRCVHCDFDLRQPPQGQPPREPV
jgi:hypothetical protein